MILVSSCATPDATRSKPSIGRIDHIVVIYAENRSFDNLYGLFPGANGIANALPASYVQVDRDGRELPRLPPVWKGKDPDPAFPKDLPNKPFRIDAAPINLPLSVATRDVIHKFYQIQEQIDGGRNDRFVAMTTPARWRWVTTTVKTTDVEVGAGVHVGSTIFSWELLATRSSITSGSSACTPDQGALEPARPTRRTWLARASPIRRLPHSSARPCRAFRLFLTAMR